jgi:hypothetical protein
MGLNLPVDDESRRQVRRLPPYIELNPGGDLLSREPSLGVPSAQRGLTTLFGMGRGVSLSLQPPGTLEVRTLKTA